MRNQVDETTLLLRRLFEASPEQVFDAWMSRDEWQAWIGPEGVDCEVFALEPRVGGEYRLEMRAAGGGRVIVAGVFKHIDRPRCLSFTWGAEGDPTRQSVITLTFTALGDKTEMILRQEGLGNATNRDQHGHGWQSALHELARYLRQEKK
jgi:uncharacterized protein YndB with AHSA1/START domain